jgi:lactate dehydrogenase-like 2-hydroxyacid dehydrogenase
MRLLYYDAVRQRQVEEELGVQFVEFYGLLESDFITIHINLTPENHHLIGTKQIDKMKKTSILLLISAATRMCNSYIPRTGQLK